MSLKTRATYAIALAAALSFILSATASAQPQSQQNAITLEPDRPVERELAGGQPHAYRLALSAGQYFELCVERRGISVEVAVYDPAGKQVAEGFGAPVTVGCESVFSVASESGTYRVEVRPLFPKSPAGAYRITLIASLGVGLKSARKSFSLSFASCREQPVFARLRNTLVENKGLKRPAMSQTSNQSSICIAR